MTSNNIPNVKLGIIAVSRDCFPIALSTQRRENIVKEYKGEIFNCQTTVENEADMNKAVAEVKAASVLRHQRLLLQRSSMVLACSLLLLKATVT